MAESVKTKFTWDDMGAAFDLCDYCNAIDCFSVCDDGATSSACNYCPYNIMLYCLTHHIEGDK